MKLSQTQIKTFQKKIYNFYKINKRDLLWRRHITPYRVLVSEIMLQQTQVPRVITKFPLFIKQFPDFNALSHASLKEILIAWQGMGYNRRAKYLKEIADIMMNEYKGRLPRNIEKLEMLPGIGKNTASSIMAFAYNKPVIFIETNIRSVYIHEFFHDAIDIHDKELLPFIEQTQDIIHPRDWYSALMDYGSFLKQEFGNPNRKSKHYNKQKTFEGSDRQLRGRILKLLTIHDRLSQIDIVQKLGGCQKRVQHVLYNLATEKLIKQKKGIYSL